MKKLVKKLRRRNKTPLPTRITSETIEQHREHILAGGRKFKYPIQYARHKLVINAIIISVTAVIIALAIGWWQLYPEQNTSEFMYHVTKVIPVPVAYVDGQPVLYSDYLMKYLSSIHYLETKEQLDIKTDDGKSQVEYIKQKSMEYVIENAYAAKLANEKGITVSDTELDQYIKNLLQTNAGEISEQTNDAVILDYYGWTPDEYRYMVGKELLRQKVSYSIDKGAQNTANGAETALKKDPTSVLKTLATTISKTSETKAVYGASGWVPKTNQDGGLALEASKLKKLEISPVIKSTLGDGYYIIRLLDINSSQVSYEYINVPLTAFTNSLNSVEKNNKVTKFISIPSGTSV
ncbi:MAG TPA: peptidylprolyl isomerase [Candidatus Saccharimonadales bacterium]|nr:peptidylprolyl isomerase [Candidatus Saccharimonadales bacterium]